MRLLATPRYDYASADAAAAAYQEARARVTRAILVGLPLVVLFCLPLTSALSASRDDPDAARLIRIYLPLYLATALAYVVLVLVQLALGLHIWTMRPPAPGADAAASYAATRANVVREGRIMFATAAGATLVVVVGAGLGVWAVYLLAGARPTWDMPVAMALPGLSLAAIAFAVGLGNLYRPDRSLAQRPSVPSTGWPMRAYVLCVVGALGIVLGSVVSVLGDGIPGSRPITVVEDGVSYDGVEFPVVVARVPALPFAAGAAAVIGWAIVAFAARTARARAALLVTGGVVTTWVGAAVEPITGRGLPWLWYGAGPGLLIALGALVLLRERRQPAVVPAS